VTIVTMCFIHGFVRVRTVLGPASNDTTDRDYALGNVNVSIISRVAEALSCFKRYREEVNRRPHHQLVESCL
jgi:hypothetical protein